MLAFDESKVDAIFAHLDDALFPGAAIGIAIEGAAVFRKGFGRASVELPVVLSPTVRMPIGSTTKHFTCLACMLLCEEGKLGLEDAIGRYVPELHASMHAITVRQLMGHVGGLRDAAEISMLFSGTRVEVTLDAVLSLYSKIDDANAAPGNAWIYNNGGYLILSALIERIAARPLEDFFRERIFAPVGMRDTLLRRFDSQLIANSATLHVPDGPGHFSRGCRSIEGLGQGGIVSTVDDMLRWLAHMNAPTVGTLATWQMMKTPLCLDNGVSTEYGLGLRVGTYRGIQTISHAGGVIGGNCQMIKVPSAGLDVIVITNRHDVSAISLARQVIDACLPGLKPGDAISAPSRIEGVFHSCETGRVVELLDRGGRQAVAINGLELPADFDRDGRLLPISADGSGSQSIELRGTERTPISIRFTERGRSDELIAAQPATAVDPRVYAGRYRCESADADAIVAVGEQRLRTVGRFGAATYAIEAIAARVWRARAIDALPLSGVLLFDAGGFHFSTSRTWKLTFRPSLALERRTRLQ